MNKRLQYHTQVNAVLETTFKQLRRQLLLQQFRFWPRLCKNAGLYFCNHAFLISTAFLG